MPRLVSIVSICAFATLASIPSGTAEITYPWCAQYSNEHGGRNCGFATLEQCRASVSGNGGYCEVNPMYQPLRRAPATPAAARR
jgi:hypothetical protein